MKQLAILCLSVFLMGFTEVEVTDLGADPTGSSSSTKAFQDAVWAAGKGGKVTCKPGIYRIANVLLFQSQQTWDCPATIMPAWNATSLFIIDKYENREKPQFLDLNFHTLNGEFKGVTCMDIKNAFASNIRLNYVKRCSVGINLEVTEQGQGIWNNNFHGVLWSGNETAMRIHGGVGCVEGSIIKVNFIGWNDLGLDMPDTSPCGGTLTIFEGGFDYNDRDAIIEAGRGYYLFGFVTPTAPPMGQGLPSSFYHIMGPDSHKTWHEPEFTPKY